MSSDIITPASNHRPIQPSEAEEQGALTVMELKYDVKIHNRVVDYL